ncbi:cytidine deaminase [bacterium]|nr:MAG: cytidine deaminase [bacterium]
MGFEINRESLIFDEEHMELLAEAWRVREMAHIIGPTKVGCAVLTLNKRIFSGCNVEHRYRSHDVHAEVNAITNMVSAGERSIEVIAIAAERERFTPCGACMDWIMQFGTEGCKVLVQSRQGESGSMYTANELMPYYPK